MAIRSIPGLVVQAFFGAQRSTSLKARIGT